MLFQSTSASPDHFSGGSSNTDEKRNAISNSHSAGDEWGQMFHHGGGDGYMNSIFPTSIGAGYDAMHAHADVNVKKEYDSHEGGSNGYYISSTNLGADGTCGLPNCGIQMLS